MKKGRYEREDPHPEDPGLVFWCYAPHCKGGVIWVDKADVEFLKKAVRKTKISRLHGGKPPPLRRPVSSYKIIPAKKSPLSKVSWRLVLKGCRHVEWRTANTDPSDRSLMLPPPKNAVCHKCNAKAPVTNKLTPVEVSRVNQSETARDNIIKNNKKFEDKRRNDSEYLERRRARNRIYSRIVRSTPQGLSKTNERARRSKQRARTTNNILALWGLKIKLNELGYDITKEA